MNSQVMKLQAENRKTKQKNHYQELIKTMEKEKGTKQILVTDKTVMKKDTQKLTSEIQREESEKREWRKEIERLGTEITNMKRKKTSIKNKSALNRIITKEQLIEI